MAKGSQRFHLRKQRLRQWEVSSCKASLIFFNEWKQERDLMCCFMQARAQVSAAFTEPSPRRLARAQQVMCAETESFSSVPVFWGWGPRTYKHTVSHPPRHLHSAQTGIMWEKNIMQQAGFLRYIYFTINVPDCKILGCMRLVLPLILRPLSAIQHWRKKKGWRWEENF